MRAGPLPGRSHPNVAAMGDRLLIVGGARFGETGSRLDGAIYDPTTDTWTSIRPAPAAIECILSCDPAIWTGREAVFTAANLAYDPSTDQWRALPECGAAGGGGGRQEGGAGRVTKHHSGGGRRHHRIRPSGRPPPSGRPQG